MFHSRDTTNICDIEIINTTRKHRISQYFKRYLHLRNKSMGTELLLWSSIKEVYGWITRKYFDWWKNIIYLLRYEEGILTRVLWRKIRSTRRREIYWIVSFVVLFPSRNSEQISPMWGSNEDGYISLLFAIWLRLKFFLLEWQIIWVWESYISLSQG